MMGRLQAGNHRWHNCKMGLLVSIALPLLLLALLLLVAVFRTLAIKETPSFVLHALEGREVDHLDESQAVDRARRFAGALAIPTISYAAGNQEYKEILKMHEYLEKCFPLIHAASYITRDVINGYSLLYTVLGATGGSLPYLLASHLDVVPVNEAAWEIAPFSGAIVNDTYIYGRGAIDDKSGVMGILEALEYQLQKGKRPKRTFYIAFGHDEEVGGLHGARHIAEVLRSRGIERLDFLLDEGMPVTRGLMPGTHKDVAIIGVTEKGSVTLELEVTATPGHSSMPPWESSIGILATAVAKLEKNPLPSVFGSGPEAQTFSDLAPHCSFLYRLLYHNLWLFSPVMAKVMEMKPTTNAVVRTTTAITMFNGGVKDNVVPSSAKAVVNLRIHPSQTVSQVVQAVRHIVNDPRVTMRQKEGSMREPHPVSPSGTVDVPYQLLAATLKQVFGDVVVVPGVLVANTDTRWYLPFTRYVYRHFPIPFGPEDVSRVHGDNERLSIAAYHRVVDFYHRIIVNADLLMDVAVPVTTEHYGAEL